MPNPPTLPAGAESAKVAAMPTVLKVQMLPGDCTAVAIVRYGPNEFSVREAGWCQSVHRTYSEALAAFNARAGVSA